MTQARPPNPVFAALGRGLEEVLNRVVALDRDMAGHLDALDGRAIELTWTGPDIGLRLSVSGGRLNVGPRESAAQADLAVSSTLAGLVNMFAPRREGAGFATGQVRMSGDAELARRLSQLAERFDPDLDGALRERFGDAAGTAIARALREGGQWAKRSATTLAEDAASYVRDESRDAVSGPELDEFLDDVDRLRDRVERASARLDRLSARVDPATRGS